MMCFKVQTTCTYVRLYRTLEAWTAHDSSKNIWKHELSAIQPTVTHASCALLATQHFCKVYITDVQKQIHKEEERPAYSLPKKFN